MYYFNFIYLLHCYSMYYTFFNLYFTKLTYVIFYQYFYNCNIIYYLIDYQLFIKYILYM